MASTSFPVHQGTSVFPTSLPPYIGAVMFETFLYGLYVILFAICAYVLICRNKTLHWILLASAVAMFALATADISYTYYLLFGKLMKGGLGFNDIRPKYWLYVTNNVLADALLLYRCYIVWKFRKAVIIGPVILLIAGTVCGYIFEGSSSNLFQDAWIYLAMTLILNLVLTVLTAGRIWWLARTARLILGTGLLKRYNATITILIESGVIYSLYIVLDLALRNHQVGNVILDAGLIQVVGIMPTLIIVQVGLGRAVHDIEANDAIEANDTIARLEATKNNTLNRSYPDIIPCGCVLSRSRDSVAGHGHHASSETFVVQHDPTITRSEINVATQSPSWPPS